MPGLFSCFSYHSLYAQGCPPNIDFETGTFDGWTCYTGTAEVVNNENVIALQPSGGPVFNRHTMYTANTNAGVDPYGGFPVNCPNGSTHSIRLGNDLAGTQAEGVSYEFTIPADQDQYSLIYHYAVVFQDPNHEQFQQPRLVIEITNVTDNKTISCSSFTFFPYGSLLPGFYESPNPNGSTPVWCKDWSAVSVNLNGNAGKRIRLFFKTADCTFRRHFGYAYIDVNSECSSEFVGSTYCKDDTAVNLTAPYGYQAYTWYNSTFTKVLGSQQTINFQPPPPVGSTYAVSVVPYNGYGCVDTLYARLEDSLTVVANAGRDTLSCNRSPVPIGGNSKPGEVYTWSPVAGLSDAGISNPVATPEMTTNYVLTANHDGGGCIDKDTVVVTASIIDSSLQLIGDSMYCSSSGDSSILVVSPTQSVQWFQDNTVVYGAVKPSLRATESGFYHALLTNKNGCMIRTRDQEIAIDDPTAGISYPIQYAVVDLPLDLSARQIGNSVLWSPGDFLNTPTSYYPVFTGNADQVLMVQLTSRAGCITIDTQSVKIVRNIEVYVPTAFTPNGDGLNDFLHPILFGIKQVHYFQVFNRLGQKLFESNKPLPGWDGTFKGIPQLSQVVAWIIEGVGADNKIYRRKGFSTLLR